MPLFSRYTPWWCNPAQHEALSRLRFGFKYAPITLRLKVPTRALILNAEILKNIFAFTLMGR